MEKYFDLKVGFACNNNCIHCVVADKRSTKNLTTEEIKKVIDGLGKEYTIGFTGGEATIREDFIELLQYAKQTGHETAVQTNGTRFADEEFTRQAKELLDYALIAIHSHLPEVHDKIVSGEGMYQKTISGFQNIIKYGIKCRTQTVISSINIPFLLETFDFIQAISPGIEMSLTYPHPNGNAYRNAEIVVSRYKDIDVYIKSILSKYSRLMSTEAIPMCYLYPYQDDISFNFDENILTRVRPGLDPANKNNDFFDEDGYNQDYSAADLSEKRKGPRCQECIFNDRCVGVWKEYMELHRDHLDLFPITLSSPAEDKKCPDPSVTAVSEPNLDFKNLDPASLIQRKISSVESSESVSTEQASSEEVKFTKWGVIIIYSTENCLNRCTFCEGTADPSDATDQKYTRFLAEADYHIKNGCTQMEISGGDPGQYPRIVEVVKYLIDHGIKDIQLSTHGRTLQDESLVIRLAQAGLNHCRIPLYGSTAEIHNKTVLYKVDGERILTGDPFSESVEGIKNCVKHGIRIGGHTVINQYNKNDVKNIIDLYLKLTSGFMMNMIIGAIGISKLDYNYTSSWYLPMKDMSSYVNQVIDHPIESMYSEIYFRIMDVPYCVIGRDHEKIENINYFPNLGAHKVEESMRSSVSDFIPHYRVKTYFSECEECSLKVHCAGITLNELKMFGTYGLKAIKE